MDMDMTMDMAIRMIVAMTGLTALTLLKKDLRFTVDSPPKKILTVIALILLKYGCK